MLGATIASEIRGKPQQAGGLQRIRSRSTTMGTPAVTPREVAENIEAQVKPFTKDLVIAEKAVVKTWSEVLPTYLRELYAI